MAKIVLSDTAPEDAKILSTAQITVEVPYETDDPDVISNALLHPWFDVDYGEAVVEAPPSTATNLPPELDALSRFNTQVDKEGPDAAPTHEIDPAALDAALNQKEPKKVGTVSVTAAAADESEPIKVSDTGSNAKPAKAPIKKGDE